MAMKEQQRTVYRSANGREVDMEKLRNQNELTLAVGNARVNARGDELGPGGLFANVKMLLANILQANQTRVNNERCKRQNKTNP